MNLHIVEIRPPRIAQGLVLLAAAIHFLTPLREASVFENEFAGSLLGLGGFTLMMRAWWSFKTAKTAICPTETATVLVTQGVFRFSRNPMYLGVTLMLLGIALFAGTVPFYVATAAFFLIINGVFCPYEEAQLANTFGAAYLSYQNRVRRWV
jgi:protein-S-isoprenylcysteine O-methyltransferase Ste14